MVGAAKYSLGWTFFLMGDFENATGSLIDFLNNYEPPSIALYPYDVDTKLRIGDAFFAQGKYNEALEYYMDTVGAEPGGDYAMYQEIGRASCRERVEIGVAEISVRTKKVYRGDVMSG